MNDFKHIFLLCLATIFCLCSCRESEIQQKSETPEQRREILEKANRFIVKQEAELIGDYIERHKLDVTETGTGLRYQIVKQGDSEPVEENDVVTLDYETCFLTGDLVYSSKKDGQKTFRVGKGGVESGLEEVVLHLHKNDVAVAILPSHLAFGLLGDGKKIPARAALVYRIKVVDIQKYRNEKV